MKIPREFFTLSEAAREINLAERELLHLATAGNLAISIWVTGQYLPKDRNANSGNYKQDRYDGLARIPTDAARKFLTKRRVYIKYFIDDEGVEFTTFPGEFMTSIGESRDHLPGHYGIEELCVSLAEVARVEKKCPELRHLDLNKKQVFQQPENGVLILSPENNQGHSIVDLGEKVPGWSGIANYLTIKSGKNVSITAAKLRLKDRRFNGSSVKQGGNAPGGVWAWSKALDSVIANPIGTKKKKEMTKRIGD